MNTEIWEDRLKLTDFASCFITHLHHFGSFQDWYKCSGCRTECWSSSQWNYQIFPKHHLQPLAYDQDICCAHIFLPFLCYISGIVLLIHQPRNWAVTCKAVKLVLFMKIRPLPSFCSSDIHMWFIIQKNTSWMQAMKEKDTSVNFLLRGKQMTAFCVTGLHWLYEMYYDLSL